MTHLPCHWNIPHVYLFFNYLFWIQHPESPMTVFLLTDPVPRYHVDAVSEYIIINNYKHLLTSFRLILTLKKKRNVYWLASLSRIGMWRHSV